MTSYTYHPKRAVLIRNAASYDFGGGERFIVGLAEELEKNDWHSIIITAHKKINQLAQERNVAVQHGWWWSRQDWSGRQAALFPVYILWQAALTLFYITLFVRLKPAVVHPQSKDDFIAATLAGKLVGAKVVWTDHADLKYIYQNVPVWYKNPIGKLVHACSSLADHITLVSKSEEQLVSAALGKPLSKQYQVIYNGIRDITLPTFTRPDTDRDALIFCVTSRLVTAKGIGELIAAFQQIHTYNPATRLWILGEGPEADKFKARAGDNPAITFWGFPQNSLSVLQAADFFVHPSYHEGFSLSIIEAAMLQKPIIACNVGGNPEIVRNDYSGLLIPARNIKALHLAMQRLLDSPSLCSKLAKNARAVYEEKFQFPAIVSEQFIPTYEG